MNFDLKTPCKTCPFRTNIDQFLAPKRILEICDGLMVEDKTFSCHNTNEFGEDKHGESITIETRDSQHCAGAMIFMEKQGKANQMMRIAERIGAYDASKLDMKAPVYANADAMFKSALKRSKPKTRKKVKK